MKLLNLLIICAVLWGILWSVLPMEKTNALVDYNTEQTQTSWGIQAWRVQYIEHNGDRCYVANVGTNSAVSITCKFSGTGAISVPH